VFGNEGEIVIRQRRALQVAAIASGLLLSGGVAAWAATTGAGHPASVVPRVAEVTGDSHSGGTSGGGGTSTTETDKPDDSTELTATTDTTIVGAPTTIVHGGDNEGNDRQHDDIHDGDNNATTTTAASEETTTTVVGATTTTVPCVDQGQDSQGQDHGDGVVGSGADGSHQRDDCGDDNDQGEDGHGGDHPPGSTVPDRGGNQGD
jgi:hypothetical protein